MPPIEYGAAKNVGMSTIIFDEPFGKERKVDESTNIKKIEEESEESLMLFRRAG